MVGLAVLIAVVTVRQRLGRVSRRGIDIAHGHVLHLARAQKDLQVHRAKPAHANVAHHDPFAGWRTPLAAQGSGSDHIRCGCDTTAGSGGLFQKTPPTAVHFLSMSHWSTPAIQT